VLANAIQTELTGPKIIAAPQWILFLLEAAVGALLVLFFENYLPSLRKALLFGVPLTFAAAGALSVMSYFTAYFVTFLPTLCAVLLFEIIQHARNRLIMGAWSPARSRRRKSQ
jgi:hypothetical protein